MTGRALIGGFDVNGQSFAFINFGKLGTGQTAITANYGFPAVLDANGYPNNSGASLVGAFGTSVFPPSTAIGTASIVIKWDGDGALQLNQTNTMTVSSKSGCTTNSDSTSNLTITSSGSGSSPRVVLSMAAGMETRLDVRFVIGKTYTNMRNLVMCRADRESLLDGGEIFDPDFIALLTLLNPKVLRLMDWMAPNDSLISQHDYRHPVAARSYRNSRWEPRAWAGTISLSSNAYTCDTAPSGFNGTLVDGATVQGQIAVGSGNSANQISVTSTQNNGSGLIRANMTSTASLTTGQRIAYFENNNGYFNGAGVWTITVVNGTQVDFQGSAFASNAPGVLSTTTFSCNGSTPKLLCSPLGVATLVEYGLCTFVYSSLLDAWRVVGGTTNSPVRGMSGGGDAGSIPIEIQVAICNKLGIDFHTNIHGNYTDASIDAHARYIRDNLNSGLKCFYEYSNENWNTGNAFRQTYQASTNGLNMGFPIDSTRSVYGWYGLRVRQMMGIVRSVYAETGATNFKGVMAFQAFGTKSVTQTYRWEGADLVTGNARYNAWTGSQSYNASPNRPIDYCDYISYATYFSGAYLSSGNYGPTGTYTAMKAACDAYLSGDTATAFAWCDTDLRSGTSTISGEGAQTTDALNTNIYPGWEALADDYDGVRATKLGIIAYEGGYESTFPTLSQLASVTTLCNSGTITFNIGSSPAVSWTAHGNANGDKFLYTTTGTAPGGANQNTEYFIVNATTNSFDISSTQGGTAITLTGSSTGTVTGKASKYSSATGAINLMMIAYKSSTLFLQTCQNQLQQFITAHAGRAEAIPAWFALQGPSKWSMMSGATGTSVFGSFDAHRLFNNRLRRMRLVATT